MHSNTGTKRAFLFGLVGYFFPWKMEIINLCTGKYLWKLISALTDAL